MILLDAGYFLALFNPRDHLHEPAVAWTQRIEEPALVTGHILWECVNAFSSSEHRPSAHAIVRYVRSAPGFHFLPASEALFEAGLRLHLNRPDKAWSLTDCISFHVMRDRGITKALAYDHHFEQAGFEALLRRDPPAES